MSIQSLGNNEFFDKAMMSTKSNTDKTNGFFEGVLGNTFHKDISVLPASTVQKSVRSISFAESDYVQLAVTEGYSYKAKVTSNTNIVYIEAKSEDGSMSGYEVNLNKVDSDTNNPLEMLALKTKEAKQTKDGGSAEESEMPQTLEEAMADFYQYIQERIKNGPEKIVTGGSEYSVKDWQKVIDQVDDTLSTIKEEMEERLEKEQEEQMQKAFLEGDQAEATVVGQTSTEEIESNGVTSKQIDKLFENNIS